MTITLSDSARDSALLERVIRENGRCERLRDTWAGVDAQLANDCHFDSGSLSVCRTVLQAWERGEDALGAVVALIDQIAALKDERERQ